MISMEYIRETADFKIEKDTVLTLGKFDGIHKGHRKLIDTVLSKAYENNMYSAVFTFNIAPSFAIKDDKHRLLTTNEEKREVFEKKGIDYLIEYPFSKETASMEPEDFIKKVIKDRINYICKEEKINITPEAVDEITYLSEGGMRDALSILDQLSSDTNNIDIDLIINNFGSVPNIVIDNIINAIEDNNLDIIKENINKMKNSNVDYKVFIKKMIDKLSLNAFSNDNKISLDKIKNVVFDLVKIINNYNININPFILIELTLLEYLDNEKITINKKEENSKIISREIILKENKTSEKEQIEENRTNISKNNNEFVKIRMNNCFVNAKKESLKVAKENLKKIIKNNLDNTFLNSMLIDSSVVVASDDIYILSCKLDSTVNLINLNKVMIEEKLDNVKIAAITEVEWLTEKQTYINNIKNGYNYEIKPEIEESNKAIKKEGKIMEDSIEDIAEKIFSNDKIEVE